MTHPPSRPREYVAYLTDTDRMRVRYFHQRGVLTDIMVSLECQIGGHWVPARRYDTHVSYHVHMFPWVEARDRRIPVPTGGSLNNALNAAIDDIKANWERLRAACEADLGRSGHGS